MRLRKWVEDVGGKAAAAKLIDCHPSYLVHLLADGSERRPGLDVAFAIERATKAWPGGVIAAVDWAATGTAA